MAAERNSRRYKIKMDYSRWEWTKAREYGVYSPECTLTDMIFVFIFLIDMHIVKTFTCHFTLEKILIPAKLNLDYILFKTLFLAEFVSDFTVVTFWNRGVRERIICDEGSE